MYSHQVKVSEETVRLITQKNGQAEVARIEEETERLEKESPPTATTAEQIVVSADGVMVPLISGEWYEVKNMAIGEFGQEWQPGSGKVVTKIRDISYFASSYRVRDFERYALVELQRRGVFDAPQIVTTNDGSAWIQSLIDYHIPQAVRIIDFSHAASYLATAGKAVLGEGTDAFHRWFIQARHQLKHKPPRETIGNLGLLQQKALSDEQMDELNLSIFYLQSRLDMIDYPHWQRLGYPIGSGSIESGHKVVVSPRLKGAGMRWAQPNLNPMLALRNLICNDRWSSAWPQIVAFRQQQAWSKRADKAQKKSVPAPQSPPLVDFVPDSTPSPPSTPTVSPKSSYKPPPDHPWRRGVWPKKESIRYS